MDVLMDCANRQACEEFPDIDARYLIADYSIKCGTMTDWDERYAFFRSYAILMFLVYPLGVPLLYFFLLFGHRSEFYRADDIQRARNARLRHEAFLSIGTQVSNKLDNARH